MAGTRIEFDGGQGTRLAARLDRPGGPARASAIFAHCFSCSKDIQAARTIAGRLAAAGIAVLRFDFTGLGHSGGEFGNGGFAGNVADLVAAAEFLAAEGMPPGLLVGHSLGGAAALAAAAQIPSVRAVATIGAPADPAHVLETLGEGTVARLRAEGTAEVTLAGRAFRLGRGFLEETEGQRLHEAIAGLRRALLILHAPRDMQVGIDEASAIFRAAKHPKSFVSLDEADHLLGRPQDAAYAADVIAAWAGRYLPEAPEPAAGAVPEGVTRVSETDPGGFAQDIRAGRHSLRADEPEGVGGTGLGPSPYQLLAAGLGACTTMTIRMYARRKGWPLAHVAVDVTHDKVHAQDCEDCEKTGARIDLFRRTVRLEGELDEAQRARLMEIADRCPVHRTLEAQARIETVAA